MNDLTPTQRVRTACGIALIVLAGCLCSWAGFVFSRGFSGNCGGDYPPCPPGTGSAFFSLLAAILACIPAGLALAGRTYPELYCAAVSLAAGGLAIGVFSSRFVADPITTGTTATWIFSGITGTIAIIAILAGFAVALGDTDSTASNTDGGAIGHSGTEL
ncbi:hypothetical protein AB0M34_21135 [Nocardia sp. NPDC050193]